MCGSTMRLCCFVMSLRARLLCSTEPSTAAASIVMDCQYHIDRTVWQALCPQARVSTRHVRRHFFQPSTTGYVRASRSFRAPAKATALCVPWRYCTAAVFDCCNGPPEIKLVRCVPRTALSETTRGSTAEEVSAYCSLCLSRALPGYGDVAPARSGLMNLKWIL